MREVREEANCVPERRIDKAYGTWYEREKENVFCAVDQVLGVQFRIWIESPHMMTSPKQKREVEAHKECAEIRKAAWTRNEIQKLIDMSVGALLVERQV